MAEDDGVCARAYKIPESVLVVIHSADLQVLLLERADRPGYWQSVTGSKARPDEALAETAVREVAEDGCVLVRPDAHVLWRSAQLVEDPERTLLGVLEQALDRRPQA